MTDLNELNDQIGKLLESKENEIIQHRIKWVVKENMPEFPQLHELSIKISKADNKKQKGDILADFLHKLFEV